MVKQLSDDQLQLLIERVKTKPRKNYVDHRHTYFPVLETDEFDIERCICGVERYISNLPVGETK